MPKWLRPLVICAESELRLVMPVDPLTRLMMNADNISVSDMEALMQRVSRSLAKRSGDGGGVPN
jgi:hypothetical protein